MATVTSMHWMSIIGFLLITIGSVLTFLGSAKSAQKDKDDLTGQIQEKNKMIERIESSNNQLVSQNTLQNKRIIDLSKQVQKQSETITGYAEGFDNYAQFEFFFTFTKHLAGSFMLRNASQYPVYNIDGRWIDLDEPIDPGNGKFFTDHYFNFGDLYPNHALPHVINFDMTNRTQLRLNFFVHFRKTRATQEIRIVTVGNMLKIANRLHFNENIIYLQGVAEDFPGYDSNNPDKVFKIKDFTPYLK